MFEGSTARCFDIRYSPRATKAGGATVDPGRSDRLLGFGPQAIRAYRAKCVGQADPALGFGSSLRHSVAVLSARPRNVRRRAGPLVPGKPLPVPIRLFA